MTEKQKWIIDKLKDSEKPMRLSEIYDCYPSKYRAYSGGKRYLGLILGKMVKNKLIERPVHGFYCIPSQKNIEELPIFSQK